MSERLFPPDRGGDKTEIEKNPEAVPTARVAGMQLRFFSKEEFFKSIHPYTLKVGAPFFQLLMIKKPSTGPSADQLMFPGGKLTDKEKERPDGSSKAALREMWEETNLPVVDPRSVGLRRYNFYYPERGGWQKRVETTYVGETPWLPAIIAHKEAKIEEVIAVTGIEFSYMRAKGEFKGTPLIDSLRVNAPDFDQLPSILTNEAINTKEILKRVSNELSTRENRFRGKINEKFSLIIEKRGNPGYDEELVFRYLYDAYLASFVEQNIGLFEKMGQAGLGFAKIMEGILNKDSAAYSKILNLISEGVIGTEDEVLSKVFQFIKAFNQDAGYEKMGSLWQQNFPHTTYTDAVQLVVDFYNQYLSKAWESRVSKYGLPLLSPYYSDSINNILAKAQRKEDVWALRAFIISCIYSSIREKLIENFGVQPPEIAGVIEKYATSNGWVVKPALEGLSEAEEISLFLGFKRPPSILRKVMERGMSLNELPNELRDYYRSAVVVDGNLEVIPNFLEYIVDKIKKKGYQVVIDVIDYKGDACETVWEEISAKLEKLGVEVKGKSEIRLPASEPKFEWVKFAIKTVKDEKTYWIEVQIFPTAKDLKEKKEDDPRYGFERMFLPGPGRLPLLRLLFDEEEFEEMLEYSEIFVGKED